MSVPSPLAAARGEAYRRRDAGDLAGAVAVLAGALEQVRPTFGEDHPEVLATAHDLARLHLAARRPAMARRVLEEALAAGQRRFGDADPLLLAISFDLGTVAEELGNRHEARRNFGRVAAAGPAVLGQDHWMVRASGAYLTQDLAAPTAAPTTQAPPFAPVAPRAAVDLGVPAVDRFAMPDIPAAPSPRSTRERVEGAGRSASLSPHVQARQQAEQAGQQVRQQAGQQAGRYPRLGPVPPEPERARRGRGTAVAAGVAAVAAVLAAVLAAVAVLSDDGGGGANAEDGPAGRSTPTVSIGGDPPRDVKVTRDGDALVLTWTDPAPGAVSFVITGGQEGEELRFVGQVTSGAAPRFPVYGYNPTLIYCFQVAAVYSTTELGVAQPVCTSDTAGR